MSRLTDQDYLQNHAQLHSDRAGTNAAFILLTPGEQGDLFRYYLRHAQVPEPDLLAHCAEISALDPSLPQRAGRALRRLSTLQERLPTYRAAEVARPRPKKNTERTVSVFSEVRPGVSAAEIAKIIWQDWLDQQHGYRRSKNSDASKRS